MRAVIRELFETVILVLLIFLALQLSVRTYRVEGLSMAPTLDSDEYVLVNKLIYLRFDPRSIVRLVPFLDVEEKGDLFPFHAPKRGEIVIFRFPKDESRDFVKRVVGVPGDTVEIKGGQVFINGRALDEDYITRHSVGFRSPVTVPPDSFYGLGDNRRASHDSREWGMVPVENMIGRAWVSFWPLDRWHALWTFPRLLTDS